MDRWKKLQDSNENWKKDYYQAQGKDGNIAQKEIELLKKAGKKDLIDKNVQIYNKLI